MHLPANCSYLHFAQSRIANVSQLPIENGEAIQFQKYEKGGFYTAHHDPKEDVPRVASFLLYLTTVEEGGETFFPMVHHRYRNNMELAYDLEEVCKPSSGALLIPAIAGRGVLFYNFGLDGEIDDMALHGSCPSSSGEKLIMQQWIQFEPHRYYTDPAMIGIWRFAELEGSKSLMVPEEAGGTPLAIVGGVNPRLVPGLMGLGVAEGKRGSPENPVQHAVVLGPKIGCARHPNSLELVRVLADTRTFAVGLWFVVFENRFDKVQDLSDYKASVKSRHTLFRLHVNACKYIGFELALDRHMHLMWRIGESRWNTQDSFTIIKGGW